MGGSAVGGEPRRPRRHFSRSTATIVEGEAFERFARALRGWILCCCCCCSVRGLVGSRGGLYAAGSFENRDGTVRHCTASVSAWFGGSLKVKREKVRSDKD